MKLRPAVHSVIFNLKNLNVFIYLERVCVCQCVSEDSLQKSVLSFHRLGPGIGLIGQAWQ